MTGETLALANEDLVLIHSNWDPLPSTAIEEEETKTNEDEVEEEESKVGSAAAQQD